MKTAAIIFVLMLMTGLYNLGISQSLILSTDNGKTCKVEMVVGRIKDNSFDLTIKTTWILEDLKPAVDNQSVIGFEVDEIFINNPSLIRIVSPQEGNVVAFNSTVKLTYEVSEKCQGGMFIFKFPFFYASSIQNALDKKLREAFTFKRPRDYSLSISFQQNDIVDKNPPYLAILSPEGVDEGLKSIVDTNMVKVKLVATDLSGIESVMVNNTPAFKESDSTFYANINLKVGYENTINVSATDKRGQITKKQFPIECRPRAKQTIATITPLPIIPPIIKPSDIDIDIPAVATPNPFKFAMIIGNEDYSSYQTNLRTESNVEFAIHDAEIFKEYAIKVVGVPEENIIFIKNAKAMEMHRALNQLNAIAKNSNGKAELYAFYAGHGFPDEKTKEPYIMPVDVSGNDLQFALKLNDFYKKLTEFPTNRVTVFLDACFSGGGRDQGLIAARGVRVKPKATSLKGNIIVFAASTGDQSSLPYRDKQHGMFTYYLLKKLKETKGEINFNELSDYLSTEVGIRSVIINTKEQNPQTNISVELGDSWKFWKIK
ncbi:MAG: caspase family protein [Bacteroidales bacterium]|nr:MAG: caspase family protein [Bacteroidales bacterium]